MQTGRFGKTPHHPPPLLLLTPEHTQVHLGGGTGGHGFVQQGTGDQGLHGPGEQAVEEVEEDVEEVEVAGLGATNRSPVSGAAFRLRFGFRIQHPNLNS